MRVGAVSEVSFSSLMDLFRAMGLDSPRALRRMMDSIASRPCGECQECCYIAEVSDPIADKPHFSRCKHQCASGCAIHELKPRECASFACLWKAGVAGHKRPDICGVMWWTGVTSDGANTLRVDVDPDRADDRAVFEALVLATLFVSRGVPVLLRARGDQFSLVMMKGPSLDEPTFALSVERIPGETDAEQVARSKKLVPQANERWDAIRSRAARFMLNDVSP